MNLEKNINSAKIFLAPFHFLSQLMTLNDYIIGRGLYNFLFSAIDNLKTKNDKFLGESRHFELKKDSETSKLIIKVLGSKLEGKNESKIPNKALNLLTENKKPIFEKKQSDELKKNESEKKLLDKDLKEPFSNVFKPQNQKENAIENKKLFLVLSNGQNLDKSKETKTEKKLVGQSKTIKNPLDNRLETKQFYLSHKFNENIKTNIIQKINKELQDAINHLSKEVKDLSRNHKELTSLNDTYFLEKFNHLTKMNLKFLNSFKAMDNMPLLKEAISIFSNNLSFNNSRFINVFLSHFPLPYFYRHKINFNFSKKEKYKLKRVNKKEKGEKDNKKQKDNFFQK